MQIDSITRPPSTHLARPDIQPIAAGEQVARLINDWQLAEVELALAILTIESTDAQYLEEIRSLLQRQLPLAHNLSLEVGTWPNADMRCVALAILATAVATHADYEQVLRRLKPPMMELARATGDYSKVLADTKRVLAARLRRIIAVGLEADSAAPAASPGLAAAKAIADDPERQPDRAGVRWQADRPGGRISIPPESASAILLGPAVQSEGR